MQNYVSPNYSSYNYSDIKTVYLGYAFCLNSKTKKPFRLFYIEGGAKYLNLNFTRTLLDFKEQGMVKNKYITYNQNNNTVKYKVNAMLFSICLQYNRILFNHFTISQKLGINFNNILEKSKLYKYERNAESYEIIADSASPGGYTTQYYLAHETIEEGLPIPFRNGISPFYSIGLGYKIKQFTPFLSGDILGFSSNIIFNYQGGIKLQF